MNKPRIRKPRPMKKPPAFQLYPRVHLTDIRVVGMTAEEEGHYIRLQCFYWEEGSLPSSDDGLRALLKDGARLVQPTLRKLRECFQQNPEDPSKLCHSELDFQRNSFIKFQKKCSDAGKKSKTNKETQVKLNEYNKLQDSEKIEDDTRYLEPTLNQRSTNVQPSSNQPNNVPLTNLEGTFNSLNIKDKILKEPIPSLSSDLERVIKKPDPKNSKSRIDWFKEIFRCYPGKKEGSVFCKTRFMDQIKNLEDYAEFERVLEKYISAHKARKLGDLKRIRWMKAADYFDRGWLKVADPEWALGGREVIFKIPKSPDVLDDESCYWRGLAWEAVEKKEVEKLKSIQDDILEFQGENPDMPKVLTPEFQNKVDNILGQKEPA